MSPPYAEKDNEFVAWYPSAVEAAAAPDVWRPRRAGFYVHLPFCTAICDYCGFAVERLKDGDPPTYLECLRREIAMYAEQGGLANHQFVCGHYGGGTPSAIDAHDLVDTLQRIRASFEVAADAEITVEVNPISFDLEKAAVYRAAGVNRISFGLQSFDDRILSVIGRPHRRGDVESTLSVIRQAGFENFSLDLIYGVPSQTKAELDADLGRVIDSGAAHVSCFRLEIIPFTVLWLREAAGKTPERLAAAALNEMDDLVSERLVAAGYHEYGAFNFARPGFESVHNDVAFMAPQNDYIGFGNSSYSFVNGFVFTNFADIYDYCKAVREGNLPIALAHRVSAKEMMSRYFVLGLKFFSVPRRPFVELFEFEPEEIFGETLERLQAQDLLRRDDDAYVLTRRGRHYVNNVVKEFYVGKSRGHRQHVQFVPTLRPGQILSLCRTKA